MTSASPPAPDPYVTFAPFYDHFTRDYEYDRWLRRLERLARAHGLAGRRVLDVGCGTGKSLQPLLALGYRGEGCDLSAAMLREAERKLPGVHFFEADMRSLQVSEPYAWMTCIDDAVNHLLGDADLEDALTSMAAALAPGGLLTFDVNTLLTHRSNAESTCIVNRTDEAFCVWRGRGCAGARREIGSVHIDFFERDRDGWSRVTTGQRERWWSDREIEKAAHAAGLTIVGRYGQRPGAIIEEYLAEHCHTKVVYFLRRV